jgi:hypothetical protein
MLSLSFFCKEWDDTVLTRLHPRIDGANGRNSGLERGVIELTNTERKEIIDRYQCNPFTHPLTCGYNSNHEILFPSHVDEKLILYCPNCDYKQEINDEFIKLLDTLDKNANQIREMFEKT